MPSASRHSSLDSESCQFSEGCRIRHTAARLERSGVRGRLADLCATESVIYAQPTHGQTLNAWAGGSPLWVEPGPEEVSRGQKKCLPPLSGGRRIPLTRGELSSLRSRTMGGKGKRHHRWLETRRCRMLDGGDALHCLPLFVGPATSARVRSLFDEGLRQATRGSWLRRRLLGLTLATRALHPELQSRVRRDQRSEEEGDRATRKPTKSSRERGTNLKR